MKLLREPLLHFLLIGAALFIVFSVVGEDPGERGDKTIIVSEGKIEQLASIFMKTWQRPPTSQELKGLVDDFLLEEVYYRQAVEMGIDRDDTIIRRRMRQKLEFFTDDAVAAIQPSEEQLAEYLAANPEKFRRDSIYTFRQVYINPEKHGDGFDAYVQRQLAALKAGEEVAGDSRLLEDSFEAATSRAVDSAFGAGFAAKLDELEEGEWQGPISSGLGVHLVKVDGHVPGEVPELSEVRPAVEREWSNEQRLASRSEFDERLLAEYDVIVEWPEESSETKE